MNNLRLIYLHRNLTRHPLRTVLTCAAVALPIVIYVLSMSVVDGIDRFLDNSARQLRLAVTHKASIVNPLPVSYRAKIESLDPARQRITSVCGLRWIGGQVPNHPRPLSTLAVDHDTFLATFPEYELSPSELEAWLRDRQAIIVGRGTAGHFGWKAGDRITIQPTLPPYWPLEFHVVSTAESAEDPVTMFCRRDFLEEEVKKYGALQDIVSFFFVKCASKADVDALGPEIDALFANSPDETKTQDEKAFMNEFVTQQFNLPRNLTILAAVTVFVAVMAATNTMSMNFRDRLNEYATLKSLGFRGSFAMSMIQSESLALCLLGGLIGAMIPFVAFTYTPLKDFTVPLIQHLEIRWYVCAQALGISLLIGLVAGLWPAWLAARMKAVHALRSLE